MIPIRIGTIAVQPLAGQLFTIEVDTTISGFGTETSSNQFKLPALGSYRVSWGDGTRQNITANDANGFVTKTYAVPGTYIINVVWVSSAVRRIWFNNLGDRNKITDIRRWGTTQWTSMENAFQGCSNLVGTFTDRPNLSFCTSMSAMFSGATNFNADIGDWNVSTINNMSFLFQNCINFNQDITLWDVSNVLTMSHMFQNASSFNQDISVWDVSSVADMSNMFDGCSIFNQNIGVWDTQSAINMSGMFFGALAFNQPVGAWNTNSLTNTADMFRSAVSFNQSLNAWNVSSVNNMSGMFRNANSFDQSLSSWNTSAVTNMAQMFQEAPLFNQNIGSWNVSNVTDMNAMFNLAAAFNQNISGWITNNVQNMSSMFREALAFNQDIGSWNTSAVTNMSNMFREADAFNQDIGDWVVSAVTDFVDFMADKSPASFNSINLTLIYNGWTNYELQTGRSINFNTIKYTSGGSEARALLTRTAATVSVTNAQNNGSGLIRITAVGHGLTTGNKVFIKNISGTTEANGAWNVTVVDPDTIDLQASSFVNAYIGGGSVRTGYGWSVADGGVE
jgi:surface protein